jgi:hypothetical protein
MGKIMEQLMGTIMEQLMGTIMEQLMGTIMETIMDKMDKIRPLPVGEIFTVKMPIFVVVVHSFTDIFTFFSNAAARSCYA